jgi:hypothetical protein
LWGACSVNAEGHQGEICARPHICARQHDQHQKQEGEAALHSGTDAAVPTAAASAARRCPRDGRLPRTPAAKKSAGREAECRQHRTDRQRGGKGSPCSSARSSGQTNPTVPATGVQSICVLVAVVEFIGCVEMLGVRPCARSQGAPPSERLASTSGCWLDVAGGLGRVGGLIPEGRVGGPGRLLRPLRA